MSDEQHRITPSATGSGQGSPEKGWISPRAMATAPGEKYKESPPHAVAGQVNKAAPFGVPLRVNIEDEPAASVNVPPSVSVAPLEANSLPPLATYTLAGIAQQSPEIVARYGYIHDITLPLAPPAGGHAARSLDSFGLTGVVPAGLGATVALTAGLSNERCTGCAGGRFMASLSGDYRILSTSVNASM